jgi:outer membrane protein assembly factor BamB
LATPSLANLDSDDDLEIVFYGYSTQGDVYAINHDGSSVQNFPVQLNEKILKGGAIYDLDNNGRDDIVVATENDKLIAIIYDDGTIVELFNSNDKFKSHPSIINYNGEIIITAGDEGGNFYGIKLDGSLAFNVITGNNVKSSAGFIDIDGDLGIFFGNPIIS